MVKWGHTIDKHIESSSFLFQKSDFVAYDNLKPTLETEQGRGVAVHVPTFERKPLLGGGEKTGFTDLIEEEIVKVALTAEERLRNLQEDLKRNVHSSAVVVSSVSDACWTTGSPENFLDQTANQRLVAATISGYIQVNAEALRKLGKKYDKCLALSLGTSQLDSDGFNDPKQRTEKQIKDSLNKRLGPIINDLNAIKETLLEKERLIEKQRHNGTTSEDKEDLTRIQKLLSELSGGKYDANHVREMDCDSRDDDDEGEQGMEEGSKNAADFIKMLTSSFQQHLPIKWMVAMLVFCLIVGFQPVFADLTLRNQQYNEATVVLASGPLIFGRACLRVL